MKDLILALLLEHAELLILLSVGALARLIELSRVKKKYKAVIHGLLEDLHRYKGEGKE